MGAEPEGRPLDHGHAFGFQDKGDEILVRLDGIAVRGLPADGAGARRINVKSAFRRRAAQARGLVEHADDQVTALLEHPVVVLDEVLGAVQASHRSRLADRRRMRRRLRLHLGHRRNQLLRPAGVTDPPSGHAKGLGHAVQRQGAVFKPRFDLGDGRKLEIVIDDVFVNVVGQNPHLIVAHQHVGQRLQVFACIGCAGRVGR